MEREGSVLANNDTFFSFHSICLASRTHDMSNFYRPQRSWAKVIFSEACVKNSVHRGVGWVGVGLVLGGVKFWEGCLKFLGGCEISGGVCEISGGGCV